MRILPSAGVAFALAATFALSGCGGSVGWSPAASGFLPGAARRQTSTGIDKIQNVIIIIQENRSFDNLFQGVKGADTQSYGFDSYGNKIKLGKVPLQATWDMDHSYNSFMSACNGTGTYPGTHCQMNGFNNELTQCGTGSFPKCPFKYPAYAYVPKSETKPYFEMASQYVLADRMFSTNFDASSFVAHQYLIAAYASMAVNYPITNMWGCEGGTTDTIHTLTLQRQIHYGYVEPVCFDNTTLGDELDSADISWRSYTGPIRQTAPYYLWNAYSAISHIYNGPDWKKDIITPQTEIFTDIKKGNLPSVSWVTPTYGNSDHAGSGSNTGPAWVASLVNAIGESKYWKSSAIFVVWDDYGGWYDHVPPKKVDYDGLGFRVPMLVISPYAKQGYVSHKDYEQVSILRFVEDRFGLPTMAASDKRALSPANDCFNFNQSPRTFVTIPSDKSVDYFLHQPLDPRPVDTE